MRLRFVKGRGVEVIAASGTDVVEGEMQKAGGVAAAGQPAYVRWNFLMDLIVTVASTVWVRNGTLQ